MAYQLFLILLLSSPTLIWTRLETPSADAPSPAFVHSSDILQFLRRLQRKNSSELLNRSWIRSVGDSSDKHNLAKSPSSGFWHSFFLSYNTILWQLLCNCSRQQPNLLCSYKTYGNWFPLHSRLYLETDSCSSSHFISISTVWYIHKNPYLPLGFCNLYPK